MITKIKNFVEVTQVMNFDFFSVLQLLGGVALFLFGMSVMGEALEKSAGRQLKSLLSNITSNPIKGFALGLVVTAIIQSSSATTVMLVGFVNSGIMTLSGAVPIIMGANVGTTITAWILSLTGLEGDNIVIQLLKPSSFTPVLAVIGVVLFCFLKDPKKKDIGSILLGFSVLIFGMETMSGAVAPLAESEKFAQMLLLFRNPLFGIAAGAVITAIIQSSSASVGILQALSSTGIVTYGTAIPIIMGQNIGTCATAMISSIGANKNAKRVAMVHLYFNIIGTVVILSVFYILNAIIGFSFIETNIDEAGIAVVHTAFNLICTAMLLPFGKLLEKLAVLTVKDDKSAEKHTLLDRRLLGTPSVAIQQCRAVTVTMAETSASSIKNAFGLLDSYSDKTEKLVHSQENEVDIYEDEIGSYLLELTSQDLSATDSVEVTKMLHMISDLERLSDHAVNIAESASEMHTKKLSFSSAASHELKVLISAIGEIIDLACDCMKSNSIETAKKVEPLEEVIDRLQSRIKSNHIERLQNNECTIELGFILTDILTDLERIADHCSNIAGCVIEIAHNSLGMHSYTQSLKRGNEEYEEMIKEYSVKYPIDSPDGLTADAQ